MTMITTDNQPKPGAAEPATEPATEPKKALRFLFILVLCYIPLSAVFGYVVGGTASAVTAFFSGIVSALSFYVTKQVIRNLLFEKSKIFFILMGCFKFLLLITVILLFIFRFHFDLPGMLIGFSVIPLVAFTTAVFPNMVTQ